MELFALLAVACLRRQWKLAQELCQQRWQLILGFRGGCRIWFFDSPPVTPFHQKLAAFVQLESRGGGGQGFGGHFTRSQLSRRQLRQWGGGIPRSVSGVKAGQFVFPPWWGWGGQGGRGLLSSGCPPPFLLRWFHLVPRRLCVSSRRLLLFPVADVGWQLGIPGLVRSPCIAAASQPVVVLEGIALAISIPPSADIWAQSSRDVAFVVRVVATAVIGGLELALAAGADQMSGWERLLL